MLIDHVDFVYICPDFLLEYVGIVSIEAFIRLEVDDSLFVVLLDIALVEDKHQTGQGHPGPHEEPVDIGPRLLLQALLEELLEAEMCGIQGEQIIIGIVCFYEDELFAHFSNSWSVTGCTLCQFALGQITIGQVHLVVLGLFEVVVVVVVGAEVGVVPGFDPLVEALHSITQAVGVLLDDGDVAALRLSYQSQHLIITQEQR